MSEYRVFWRSKRVPSSKGYGEPMPLNQAVIWRDYHNKHYPEIVHWIAKDTTNELDVTEMLKKCDIDLLVKQNRIES